ncbi:MAG: hypothetical protein JSW28_06405, partial [Thermoplasmata archaeon]
MQGLRAGRAGNLAVCAVIVMAIFAGLDGIFDATVKVEAVLPGWKGEVCLSDGSQELWGKDIAVWGNDVHIVWSDKKTGDYEIYYKRSIDNGLNWSNDKILSNSSGWDMSPNMAVFDNYVHVVFEDGDGAIAY